MIVTFDNVVVYIALISFIAGVADYLISMPLRNSIMSLKVGVEQSIVSLQKSIDKLDTTVHIMNDKLDEYRERLVKIEESSKQAHKRIDRMECVIEHLKHVDINSDK